MRIFRLLISCVLAAVALHAQAFERPFPEKAKRGAMTPDNYPRVLINDKQRHLSAGARIWSQDNLIVMPASIRGEDIPVLYTEDNTGDIDRIWMLTSDEVKRIADKPAPKPLPAPVSSGTDAQDTP